MRQIYDGRTQEFKTIANIFCSVYIVVMCRRASRTPTKPVVSKQATNAEPTGSNMNQGNGGRNAREDALTYFRENSAPLNNNVRLVGSPRASSGPRKAIIIIYIIRRPDGIDGIMFEFRRFEEPDKGTYVEKLFRDQVRQNDPYLLAPPMNVVKTSFGAHRNNVVLLNDKGYELSVFVAMQNFQGKTEEEVRHLAKMFGMAIKEHIESDPNCQNQLVVVSEENIHYNEDAVYMDFIGERNAVRLYRSILPVDSTPGYSQYNVEHARSFFREGTLSPESVAFIKSDDTFLARAHRDDAGRVEPQGADNNGNDNAAE